MSDPQPPNPSGPVPRKSDAARSAFRVLVIDDNEVDREITNRHLRTAWPFDRELVLDFAADGTEALQKMSATRYALFVLDWKLPGIGGGDVLRHVRQGGVRMPIVVVSGLQRDQIPDDLASLGAAFLNKDDMNPSTFYDAIAESLRLLKLTQPAAL